jgi:hypothetical protein
MLSLNEEALGRVKTLLNSNELIAGVLSKTISLGIFNLRTSGVPESKVTSTKKRGYSGFSLLFCQVFSNLSESKKRYGVP